MWKYGILIIALICALFVAGCTSQPAAPAAAPAAVQATGQASGQGSGSGATATVLIEDKAFNPAILNIDTGTKVTWINQDTVSHRVVHQPGPGETELFHSDRLDPGQSFSYTFTQPGRYNYADPQYAGGRTSLVIVTNPIT
ncbi:MAG TPA: plastocyanin/azurin family copper-binding protein [Methanoregula sp.]|nr:plastocyanin/azurin family copper-binding protein [Methanoregula sp.]